MLTDNKFKAQILLLLLVITATLGGCQKSPINGDLDGQWQVMQVEPQPPIVFEQRMYYCISLHVCQLSIYDEGVLATGNLNYSGDTLTLDFRDFGTEHKDDLLRQFGINENPIVFKVEFPDKNKLILRSDDTVVTLRRF